ncbi:OmpH family outer membrane protein [Pedobacter sp. SYP-B3415]|uniref:OmpH family outer membrane protein n=1 Tax=Pedobacter sp. SYP-B3415 TaxID=2496641 RepID=UPI00101C92A7|nr:OmpH family outer membrane protein [Pedobacter sp. SYP-B3415]
MRKLINVFFVAGGLVLAGNVASAQQKIAHLNSEEIFATLPEAKTAQTTLETLGKQKQAEITKMTTEFQTKLKAAQDKERTLSEANKETVTKELQSANLELQELQKRITDANQKADQELRQKQADLLNPMRIKIDNAIKTVAKEKGLSYVFDTSDQGAGNNVVFWDGGDDITGAVKTKLGISATAKPAAAAPAATKK